MYMVYDFAMQKNTYFHRSCWSIVNMVLKILRGAVVLFILLCFCYFPSLVFNI